MAPPKKESNVGDPIWEHCSRINDNRINSKCNYCGLERWGRINRMKHHLASDHSNVAPCTQCPKNVRDLCIKFLEQLERQKSTKANESIEEFGGGEQGVQILGNKRKATMEAFIDKGKGVKQQCLNALVKKREPAIESICRFLYGHALPFVLVKSPLFASMVEYIGDYGRGLKPPSYH